MPGLSGNRLNKIKQTYQDKLASYIKDNGMDISVDNMFYTIVCNDPSHDKRYTRWLVETLLNDGYLFEDLSTNLHVENNEFDSKVTETLRVFMKHSRKLDIVDRSINRYQSIADMWKMVKQYADNKTGKEIKRDEYDRAMDESEVVVDNGDIRIVVPLTEYASKFHGRGTRWCTAADNNNIFWNYAKKAPLFIITLKGSGDKLQLWKYRDDIQFMDEDDKNVSMDYIKENWNVLQSIILGSEGFKGFDLFEHIPEELVNPELLKLVNKKKGFKISQFPHYLRTPEMCEMAIKNAGWALEYVPDDYITPELCEIAVKQNGMALYFVPDEFKTPELCKLACKQNGHALLYVPKEYTTSELYKLACEQDGMALRFVSDEKRTYELCQLAVNSNTRSLCWIPSKFITYELCKMVCDKDGFAFRYVPKHFQTSKLCKVACQQNGCALQYVPEYTSDGVSLKTYELCKIACEQNGMALEYVPKEFLTSELCEIACISDGLALKQVPKELRTNKMCRIAIERSGMAILFVKNVTPELCEIAVKQNGYALRFISPEFRTLELCKIAVQQHECILEYVPNEYAKTFIQNKYIHELNALKECIK